MAEKAPDEIMAEYLLKGGKMLAKTCPACGSPVFSIRGEERCVVCDAERAGSPAAVETGGAAPGETAVISPVPAALTAHPGIAEAVAAAVIALAERVPREAEPHRCRELMQAIREGAEAIRVLRQG